MQITQNQAAVAACAPSSRPFIGRGMSVSALTVITEPGWRALGAVAVSVCEQDGGEHVGQPALVGLWVA